MSDTPLHDTPYKGLLPYSEEDEQFFFGREPEQEVITANLMASRLTLLYGPSGVGKSSVLRAGVAADLRQQARENLSSRGTPRYVVVVFRDWKDDPLTGLLKEIRQTVKNTFAGEPFKPVPTDLPFAAELAEWTERIQGKLFIVLDQFEEYFLYPQREDESSFAVQFPRAVNRPELRVNFLISIREDWLAKLDRFKVDITNLFDNYLRIDRLDRTAARAAIEQPVARYNEVRKPEEPEVHVRHGFAKRVIEQLEGLANKNPLGQSGSGQVKGLEESQSNRTNIQPPYLQLVMIHLWTEALQSKTYELHPQMLVEEDRAEKIVQSHLDEVMKKLSPEDQEAASRVFHHLVTPSGVKVAQTLSDLAGYADLTKNEIAPMLNRLSEKESGIISQLVPPPGQPSEIRYEIYHDVLAPAVLCWRLQYVTDKGLRDAREREEKARLNAKAQTRIATRLRWVSLALLVITVLAVFFAVFGIYQSRKAKRLQNENELTKLILEGKKTEADNAIAESNRVKEQARIDRDAADNAIHYSETIKQLAETERARADQTKLEALAATNKAKRFEQMSNVYDDVITLTRAKDLNHVKEKYIKLGEFYEKSDELSKQANQLLQVAETVRGISLEAPSLAEALKYYVAARSLYRRDKNLKGEAEALIGIGQTQKDADQQQLALDSYVDAATVYKQAKDKAGVSEVITRINDLRFQGDIKEIASWVRLLPVLHGMAEYREKEIAILIHIGDINFALERRNETIKYYTSALELDRNDTATLKVLGDLYYLQNDLSKAVSYYEEADKLFRLGAPPGTTNQLAVWASLGDIYRQQRRKEKAAEYYSRLQGSIFECLAFKKAADMFLAFGDKQAALDYYLKIMNVVDLNPACLSYTAVDNQFSGPLSTFGVLAQPLEVELGILSDIIAIYTERGDTESAAKFSQKAERVKALLRGEKPPDQRFD